jgi:RimJ/RimL family protein N-acetyltransferase
MAAALGLPMLDKDEILEAMFNSQGVGNAEWRTRLSRAADEILQEKSARADGAVITSWWRHPASRVDSGTPVEWLLSLAGVAVEVHCVCDPHIATERFLTRRRHEGHLDKFKTHAKLLVSFQEQAALGPLGFARLVKVNTEQSIELETLLAQIDFVKQCDGIPVGEASQPLRTKQGPVVICPDEIEGPRILLKPVEPEHAQEIFAEFTPEITTYMLPRSPSHISETQQFTAEAGQQRAAGTDLQFVVRDKHTNEFLGVCGLHSRRNQRRPEFGIWLKKAAHKKALGLEAINVLKAWSEQTLSIEGFVYPVDRRNQPSRRIAETLGGKVVSECKVRTMSGGELDELVYLIPLSAIVDSTD